MRWLAWSISMASKLPVLVPAGMTGVLVSLGAAALMPVQAVASRAAAASASEADLKVPLVINVGFRRDNAREGSSNQSGG